MITLTIKHEYKLNWEWFRSFIWYELIEKIWACIILRYFFVCLHIKNGVSMFGLDQKINFDWLERFGCQGGQYFVYWWSDRELIFELNLFKFELNWCLNWIYVWIDNYCLMIIPIGMVSLASHCIRALSSLQSWIPPHQHLDQYCKANKVRPFGTWRFKWEFIQKRHQ